MNEQKLDTYQAISVIVTVMLSHIILNLPNHLIETTGSSSILNLIYVFSIVLLICWIVTKIFKLFPNNDIIDICEYAAGKAIKILYTILLCGYLLVISALVIRTFAESLSLIYFPNIRLEIIILFFIIMSAIMNLLGFKAIARTSVILLPIILIAMLVVFIYSTSDFTVQRSLPLLGYSAFDTFVKGLGNIFAFSSALIIVVMAPLISDGNRMRKVGFVSLIIYGICVIAGTVCLLFLIPSVGDVSNTLTIYVVSKRVSLGSFVQSIDSLFILVWIICIFNYLAISLHFAIYLFKKIVNVKHELSLIYPFSAIVFVISMLPKNSSDLIFYENTVYKYSSIIFVFFISFAILICAYLKKKHEKGVKHCEKNN